MVAELVAVAILAVAILALVATAVAVAVLVAAVAALQEHLPKRCRTAWLVKSRCSTASTAKVVTAASTGAVPAAATPPAEWFHKEVFERAEEVLEVVLVRAQEVRCIARVGVRVSVRGPTGSELAWC